MLTKGSVTKGEWNHLVRLLIIMIAQHALAAIPVIFFLILHQKAMSKRGPEGASSDGSPMPKPTPGEGKTREFGVTQLACSVECEEQLWSRFE